MQKPGITSSVTRGLFLVLCASLGITLVLLSTQHYGAGLTPDSVGYISAARNIIAGHGVTTYTGAHLVVQPPLYPTMLAFAGAVSGMDPLLIAAVVNAILFGLIIFFGGVLTFRALSAMPLLAPIGVAALVVSIPLYAVSMMAWSEPLFILLSILGILAANSYIEKQDLISLLLLSLAVALSTLTRYAGIVFVLWGICIVIFFCRGSMVRKLLHVTVFILIPAISLGLWLLRNYAIAGEPFGPRAASIFSFSQNLMFMFDRISTWYIPRIISDHRATLLIFGVAIGFIAGLSPEHSWKSMAGRMRQNGALVLFIIVYSTFLIISSTTTAFDSIGNRLLSPIYVPFTLFIFILLEAIAEPYRRRFTTKAVNFVLLSVLAIWLLYPLSSTLFRAENVAQFGRGYSSALWRQSETIRYLRRHSNTASAGTMYSNAADAMYILTTKNVTMSPARTSYHSNEAPVDILSLRGTWPADTNAHLVWFDAVDEGNLFPIEELQSIATITLLKRFADGAMYSVARK